MTAVYFVDLDGHGDETLWRQEGSDNPSPVLRYCDLPSNARHLWGTIARAVGA